MGYEYKCVAAPKELIIKKQAEMDKAVAGFANIINNEAVQGWEFYSMEQIATTVPVGCLAAWFGKKEETTYSNMLISRRMR